MIQEQCESNGYTPFENAVQEAIKDLVSPDMVKPISTRVGGLYRQALSTTRKGEANKEIKQAIYALELAVIREEKGSDLSPDAAIRLYKKTIDVLSAPTPRPAEVELDMNELKQYALNEFMKGRSSKELREIAFEIISETFNVLKMKGYLKPAAQTQDSGNEGGDLFKLQTDAGHKFTVNDEGVAFCTECGAFMTFPVKQCPTTKPEGE